MSTIAPEIPGPNTDTLLRIDGRDLPKGCAWNLDCGYDEEQLGEWKRNLRGGLTFFGIPENGIRFGLSIAASGVSITGPILELNRFVPHEFDWPIQWTMSGMVDPDDLIRPAVEGSVRYMGYGRNGLVAIGTPDQPPADVSMVVETWWRPRIKAVITGRSASQAEAAKGGSWSLALREDMPL